MQSFNDSESFIYVDNAEEKPATTKKDKHKVPKNETNEVVRRHFN